VAVEVELSGAEGDELGSGVGPGAGLEGGAAGGLGGGGFEGEDFEAPPGGDDDFVKGERGHDARKVKRWRGEGG
jgi:hypothetical protein